MRSPNVQPALAIADPEEEPDPGNQGLFDRWPDFVVIGVMFLVWRTGLTILTYAGSKLFPLVANGGLGAIGEDKTFDYWASWAQWDGAWFYHIARDGYFLLPGESEFRSVAFFPLYPLLTKGLSYLLSGDGIASGLIISNVAFFAFLVIFFRLVRAQVGHEVALTSTVSLLAFPTAYFGTALYSEALFLLLVALSFLCLEKNKGIPASAFAGLAAATRLVGVAAWLPLGVWAFKNWSWNQRSVSRLLLGAAVALIPIGLYCAYLQDEFGDPFYFFHVGSEWLREPQDPITTIASSIQGKVIPGSPEVAFNNYLDLAATVLFFGILLAGFRKIPFDWWLFSFVVILIPASSGLLFSMPRYILASLGVFVIVGKVLHQRTALRQRTLDGLNVRGWDVAVVRVMS